MSEKYIPQYIPLYRKYRPQNLGEVVGQEHIKKALTNAISLNKISHAYLFTGPRGTGKTSVARILAKSLNCVQGPTLTPCEVCASCIDIKNSTPMDVIEIDAASNRKVEDARNILEKIQYVPANGKYKIYIIDEVHMLTKEAFNTLLKTLEEPPENVIFILATTEPQKVLETITSRCQRFDFRRITTTDIVNHLKEIAEAEKIKIEEDALFTIAKNAGGGMRDSLALLDQVSVLDSTKAITTDDINKILGRLSFDMLNSLSETIIQSQPQNAIEQLTKIYNSGNEPAQILINLMGYFKNLLIIKTCQGEELLAELTQLNSSQINALKTQAGSVDIHQITFLIEKIIYYIKELKTSTNQHLWLEIAIIDLANLAQNTSLIALQDRITTLENKIESGNISTSAPKVYVEKPAPVLPPAIKEETETGEKQKEKEKKEKEITEEPKVEDIKPKETEELPPAPLSKPAPADDNNITGLWHQLLQNISSTPTVSLLSQHARPIEINEDKVIIGCKENFLKMLSSDSKRSFIEEGVRKIFNKDVSLVIKLATSEESQVEEKKNIVEEANKQTGKDVISNEVESSASEENAFTPDEIDEEEDYIENELAKKKPQKFIPSDQVSMVMNLFDGKYIE